VEAEHEEADVLHEEGDEAEEDPGADGNQHVAPHGKHVLLQADLREVTNFTKKNILLSLAFLALHFWQQNNKFK
jgi:hypothetical protein